MAIRSVPDGDVAWGPDLRSVIARINALTDAVTGLVPVAQMGTGTPTSTTVLYGNGAWGTQSTGLPTSTLTTKGDIIATLTGGTATRKAIGSDLQVLIADSAQTDGLRWGAVVVPSGAVADAQVASGAAISADKLADGTTNKVLLATERTKLTGIATGATANSTDATLLARANHTGTQSADTLTDGTTNKAFLATERTKLTGIASGATANSADSFLLARANHTGTQSADTLTDGTTNKAFLATERTKLTAIGTVRTVSASAGVIAIDASTAGNNLNTSLSADATLNVPTNGVDGQVLQGSVLASAAQRVLTFHASYGRLGSITNTLTIPSGKIGRYAVRRTDVTGSAVWIVEAASVQQ
jgi:hypothetical protein